MFGLGGIFTEIYHDVQFCLLPAKDEEFRQMIRSVRGYPLLSGARGQAPKDEEALVEIMKALARLATANPQLDQIELNPLLVYERGVFAVDAQDLQPEERVIRIQTALSIKSRAQVQLGHDFL